MIVWSVTLLDADPKVSPLPDGALQGVSYGNADDAQR